MPILLIEGEIIKTRNTIIKPIAITMTMAALAAAKHAFDANESRIAALGFDERFRRMWRYYLAYCEGGFRVGRVDVRQIVLAR